MSKFEVSMFNKNTILVEDYTIVKRAKDRSFDKMFSDELNIHDFKFRFGSKHKRLYITFI